MPKSKTLPRLLAEVAARYPEREALIAGETRLTYAQLQDEVQAAAGGLHALGVRHGDRLAILMGNRSEWIIAWLAASTLGAITVAVNTWCTARELAYVLNHSAANTLVAVPSYLRSDYDAMVEKLRSAGELPHLKTTIAVGDGDRPASWLAFSQLAVLAEKTEQGCVDTLAAAVQPADIALLVYTSGSTSAPKGVQLVHQSLIENTWRIGERQGVTHEDRLWLAVSLFWGFGCSNAVPNLLSHGGCIVLQESFEPGRALQLIERERCTLFYGTPNMAQAMHEHPDRAKHDLSSLRSGSTLGYAQQIMRVVDLGARQICNVYGLTEIYGHSHVTRCDAALELRLHSVGQPLEGVSQRIVDVETEADCLVGAIGEIRLKGYVTPGYYQDPETTARSIDEQGYFRTGDLGLIDTEGHLYFRGRLKEVVKTGGILVSPAEVEAVLMTHPGVHLALVVGIADPVRDEVLAAVIVPASGRDAPAQSELVLLCQERLAAYKVPKRFWFTSEAELPLTTTGKVQKNRLAAKFSV